VVIMGPVGGGRLGETGGTLGQKLPPGVASTPELALRFVMANPNVTIALSGMSTMEQVTENVAVPDSAGPLTPEQTAAVDELMGQLKAMADLYCTGCGYCKPCPNGVAIPDIFRLVNQYRVYGAKASAIDHYRRLIKHQKDDSRPADACVECGKCEEKCPQHIKIMEQLKQAHELLTVK